MEYCWLCCVLFLCVNFNYSVSAQTENVSDLSVESTEKVPNKIGNNSENIQHDYDWSCNCGPDSNGCTWSYGEKYCYCNTGYSQKGDKCEKCDCGYNSRGCSFASGEKVCNCISDYANDDGSCRSCDCGESMGCSFENGVKTCRCYSGAAQRYDKCEECKCGRHSKGCKFNLNKKVCSCDEKFKQNHLGECEECDCGYNSESCEFEDRKKKCTCKYKYVHDSSSGKCERCYCGPMATSCELTFDKYTRCKCYPGYVAERSKWDMDEECRLPTPSGWRVATYIEAVLFGLIIIISGLLRCCKRVSYE